MPSDNSRRTGKIHLSLSMNLGIGFSWLGVNPKACRLRFASPRQGRFSTLGATWHCRRTSSPRPSGEKAGARGFEFKRTTSPRPSPPTSLAERENRVAVSRCAPVNMPAFSLAAQSGIFYSGFTAVTEPVKARDESRLACARRGAAVSDRIDLNQIEPPGKL